MRIFRTKVFSRFARKEGLDDEQLRAAAQNAVENPDAQLGGEVVKQRVARTGSGKSSGYRTIICLRADHRAVFLYGFAKNDRDNVTANELAAFRKLATFYLGYDDAQLATALKNKQLTEISQDDTDPTAALNEEVPNDDDQEG